MSRPLTRGTSLGALVLAWSWLLASCAPGGAAYDRPGGTYRDWRRDDAACRKIAMKGEEETGLDRNAYARCMRERGYRISGE
jgi:hypothetical protein